MNNKQIMPDASPWPFEKGLAKEHQIAESKALANSIANSNKQIAEAEKLERAKLIAYAKSLDVGIVHIFDVDYPKGGMTVAYQKSTPYNFGDMVRVAVATCSEEDTFNRKIGTTIALNNFFDGKIIELPLLRNHLTDDLSFYVKNLFTRLNNAM